MKYLSLILVIVLAISCKNDPKSTTATATSPSEAANAAANPQNATNPTVDPNAASTAATGPTTTMKFDSDTYDFGKAKAGPKFKHRYEFTNTGNEKLIISTVKPGCGCTTTDYTKEPVEPGKKGFIEAVFNSEGQSSGPKIKTINVIANTNPPQSVLMIKGELTDGAQPKTIKTDGH